MCCIKIPGFVGALIEVALFASGSQVLYHYVDFEEIDVVTYYWCMFTILTGFWEAVYIFNHRKSVEISKDLIEMDYHVWCEKYPLTMILPWKLSVIFYGEYGAYADREYMTDKDNWSRLIEGTHALFCGLFSLVAIILNGVGELDRYNTSLTIAMGSQLMNSILYMGEYAIQTKNKDNINYNNSEFPLGILWFKRPFMYINLFWTVMPIYALTRQLCEC